MTPHLPTANCYLGTAGWSIPARSAASFVGTGSHLEKYATKLNAVEINSSFYRTHQRKTYERWAATTPNDFRFSVKLPRQITHDLALRKAAGPLDEFLATATGLGVKLGCLLIQLPPSLAYDARTARTFFAQLRQRYAGAAVCEPRHATWFSNKADDLLREFAIARVCADPPAVKEATPTALGGSLHYYRLHGSPQIYYSEYSHEWLEALAGQIREALSQGTTVWCIFDNTALGYAMENGLQLRSLVSTRVDGANDLVALA